jgi:hypothetical protein
MKPIMLVAVAAAVLVLGGCEAMPIAETRENVAISGPRPDANYFVDQYIHTAFKDPYSVQELVVQQPVLYHTTNRTATWRIVFSCNAKNSFGAYIGRKAYVLFVRNGAIDWQHMQTIATLQQMIDSLN